MYGLQLITPPDEEPVSLAEAREWLAVEHSGHNAMIGGLVSAARLLVEATTGAQLVTATWKARFGCLGWRGFRLPRWPVQSVTGVGYVDYDGEDQTLDPASYELSITDRTATLTPVYGLWWPHTLPGPSAASVTFVAGFGTADDVPEPFKAAIKMILLDWYGRDAAEDREMPKSAAAILDAYSPGYAELGEVES